MQSIQLVNQLSTFLNCLYCDGCRLDHGIARTKVVEALACGSGTGEYILYFEHCFFVYTKLSTI